MRRFVPDFLLAAWVALILATLAPAMAEAETMSAPEALAAIKAGDLVLLDIRTPEEWQKDGVAKGAWPVSMHQRDFGKALSRILRANPDKKIGLICATGGRSNYVLQALQRNGVANIVDVNEGMHGSPKGPGWLRRGLPVVDAKTAVSAIPGNFHSN